MTRAQLIQAARYIGLVLLVLAAGVVLLESGMRYLPYPRHVPLEVRRLPGYALWSFGRMLVSYLLALVFSIAYGYVAATNKRAERVMMPLLDILQSVPVVGFFPAATYFFVNVTHGSRLGVEMASVLLIFTSQAWNMAFGCYEAITTIPQDSFDALGSMGVYGLSRFRRLYLPACVPKLVYNSILSWAGGWYFLIACEIITVGPVKQPLPGLGSFLAHASEQGQTGYMVLGVLVLVAIVVGMHLLLWRPLESWSEKFRYEFAASTVKPSRMLRFWREIGVGRAFYRIGQVAERGLDRVLGPLTRARRLPSLEAPPPLWRRLLGRSFGVLAGLLALYLMVRAGLALGRLLKPPWPARTREIPLALAASFVRLACAYVIALLWTVPVAVIAGNRPRMIRVVEPFAQVAASVPATALFPLIVVLVIRTFGSVNVAAVLLVLTGMQWYLLFNLLAGVHSIPGDLREATQSLGLSGWQQFRTLTLPAMLPSLVTGSITGWGGGWNALILSEYIPYAHKTYKVLGIGALLQEANLETHDDTVLVLSLSIMVLFIVIINRLFWRPMYVRAADRFKVEY